MRIILEKHFVQQKMLIFTSTRTLLKTFVLILIRRFCIAKDFPIPGCQGSPLWRSSPQTRCLSPPSWSCKQTHGPQPSQQIKIYYQTGSPTQNKLNINIINININFHTRSPTLLIIFITFFPDRAAVWFDFGSSASSSKNSLAREYGDISKLSLQEKRVCNIYMSESLLLQSSLRDRIKCLKQWGYLKSGSTLRFGWPAVRFR